jgi:hypothetical protein
MKFLNKIKDFFMGKGNDWKRLKFEDVPKWLDKPVKKWYDDYENKNGHEPYNIVVYFYGKKYKYKIHFKGIGTGEVHEKIYRKKRGKKK